MPNGTQPKMTPPVDEKQVLADLQAIHDRANFILPHLNKANAAFGGLDQHIADIQDIITKVQKAKAVYSQR